MIIYEKGSKLDKNLNRISIVSYLIVIILGLLGFLFIYMDITFLFTAILTGIGFNKYGRESLKQTYIIFGIAIIANILRTIFTFPEYRLGAGFTPYFDISNFIGSVIILTYIGIIMIILYYRNDGKYTLFNLSCAFGILVFLKDLAMFLLLYFLPPGNGPEEIVNQIYLIHLITIIISGTGIIILAIAKKVNLLIFVGISLGIGILGVNLWFLIFILPKYRYLIPPTEGLDFIGLLDFSIFCSFISILWILIMILLLIYNVVVNRKDLFRNNKINKQNVE